MPSLQDDLQNFHSIYKMDKIRGSLCLGWKRVYGLVSTRKSNSDGVAASW